MIKFKKILLCLLFFNIQLHPQELDVTLAQDMSNNTPSYTGNFLLGSFMTSICILECLLFDFFPDCCIKDAIKGEVGDNFWLVHKTNRNHREKTKCKIGLCVSAYTLISFLTLICCKLNGTI